MDVKILIVDANEHVSERLFDLLIENKNVTGVCTASTYEKAIRFCKEYEPEVILVDMELPGDYSIRLLEYLHHAMHTSIIVALSMYPEYAIRKQCENCGAHYFFDKYYEFDKLTDLLNKISLK